MKKLLLAALAAALWCVPNFAQGQNSSLSNPVGGAISVSGANCAVANVCVWQKLPPTATTTTVTITGTFSATLIVESSADGGTTWTQQSSQTAATVVTFTTTSLTDVRVRCSAFVSGTASVNIQTAGNQLNVTVNSINGGSAGFPVLLNQSVDVFNRTGANLGANWTQYLNTIATTPGAAVGGTASQYNLAAWTGTATVPTQSVRCSLPTVGTDSIGCALRISGTPGTSASMYVCLENTTQAILQRVVGATNASAGAATLLASQARPAVAGDYITVSIVGNTITCAVNNITPMVAFDASPLTTGAPGIAFFGNVSALGSFTLVNPTLPAGATANIIFDGDSILAANGNGSPSTDPATSFLYLPYTGAYVTNLGVSGKCLGIGCAAASLGTIESMLSTGTSVADTLFVPGVKNILVIFGGTNDIAGGSRTPAQVNTDLTTYITARHAAGWKVISVPPVSRATTALPLIDAKEAILASLIQANTAGADAVVTLPISLIAPGSSLNTNLFNADQVHPTEITHIDIFARAFIAALSKF